MKTPLSVYVIYHSENREGKVIYDKLYNELCRDSRNPLSDGLDIPVFYCTGNDNGPMCQIDFSRSSRVLVLLLIDNKIYLSQSWHLAIKDILTSTSHKDYVQFLPVSQCNYAYEFNSDLQNEQFIVLSSHSVLNNWEEFKTRLFDCLIRFIKEKKGVQQQKINIFISHSKKDKDKIGVNRAIELRDYLRQETKLSSFFDVNDILDGLRFDKQIEDNIANSILLILFTNSYSSREWCRREVLTAKKNRIPAIAVFMIDGDVNRVFPYIGNIPSTIYTGQWRSTINLLLRTALDQYNEQLLLDSIKDSEETESIPFAPEAYSFSIIKDNIKNVLYPEPPLGTEELEVLEKIGKGIKFYTPMQYLTKDINLNKAKIALSVSECDKLESLGIGRKIIDDLLVEISRHLLIANAQIVFGGDLRSEGYTELLKDLSFQYGLQEKSNSDVIYFTNYLAWPIYLKITENHRLDYLHSRVQIVEVPPADECKVIDVTNYLQPSSVENLFYWGRSLTKMRETMEDHISARILVGGRLFGFKGSMAGVLEEFAIAKRAKHPIFLVGAFGGVTQILADIIEGKCDSKKLSKEALQHNEYKEVLNYYENKGFPVDYSQFDRLNFSDLNNGLEDEQNKILFHSTNVMEIVSLILEGLQLTINFNRYGRKTQMLYKLLSFR